jgi:hypothetical protein
MIFPNKKGNAYAVVLVAFMLFTVGFIVANFLKAPIDDARVSLDCTNASGITDGTKLLCLNVDFVMIYWIILIFSLAGGVIVDKLIAKESE